MVLSTLLLQFALGLQGLSNISFRPSATIRPYLGSSLCIVLHQVLLPSCGIISQFQVGRQTPSLRLRVGLKPSFLIKLIVRAGSGLFMWLFLLINVVTIVYCLFCWCSQLHVASIALLGEGSLTCGSRFSGPWIRFSHGNKHRNDE